MSGEMSMPSGGRGEIAVPDGEHGEPASVLGDLLKNASHQDTAHGGMCADEIKIVFLGVGRVGLWQDRADICDSSVYARQLREQAQEGADIRL